MGPDGALYVCNNGGLTFKKIDNETRSVHGLPDDTRSRCIQRIDIQTGAVQVLYSHRGDIPLSAPNDLVFDVHGGFYFTDIGRTRHRMRDIGAVYYARPDGSEIREIIHPIANPNGIGISPDGSTLYVAETETARLRAYPIVNPAFLRCSHTLRPMAGASSMAPRAITGSTVWQCKRMEPFAWRLWHLA